MDTSRTIEFLGEEREVLLIKAQYGLYFVRSSEDDTQYYPAVKKNSVWSCTCADHEFRKRDCKHIKLAKVWDNQLYLQAARKWAADLRKESRERALAKLPRTLPVLEPDAYDVLAESKKPTCATCHTHDPRCEDGCYWLALAEAE